MQISTAQELESAVSSVQHAGFTGDIECSGSISKDIGSFFSTYERSNELGWWATGVGVFAIGAAIVVSGGLAAVAGVAIAAVGAGLKGDYDLKATRRLSLGDLCFELAKRGYRMKRNRPGQVLISCK